MCFCEDPLIKK